VPAGIFKAKDRYIFIIAPLEHQFSGLCRAMGQPDLANDPRFKTNADRLKNLKELVAAIEAWFKSSPSDDASMAAMNEYRVPHAPVLSLEEAMNHPHLRERGTVAEVHDRVETGARHREQRHRLGEAVDGVAPILSQEQQDGRDERAGVADPDPPDEIGDVPAPADRNVHSVDPHARQEQMPERAEKEHDQEEGDAERGEPPARRAAQDDRADFVGHRRGGVPGRDERGTVLHPFSRSGWGLRSFAR